jgi:hypothetical protein
MAGQPSQDLNLQTFDLNDLAVFTRQKIYSSNASKDFHLFFVGVDDVHGILVYLLSRVTSSLFLNMYGYDDAALNDIIMQKVMDPTITVLITLDKSESGSSFEKQLLAADQKEELAAFNTHFVIGQSATHQISHTKGFVADGKVGAEGSTNWSKSGEGVFILPGQPGGSGYKAQNNTQTVFVDPDSVIRFQNELMMEHMAARDNEIATNVPADQRQRRPSLAKLASARYGAMAAHGKAMAEAAG